MSDTFCFVIFQKKRDHQPPKVIRWIALADKSDTFGCEDVSAVSGEVLILRVLSFLAARGGQLLDEMISNQINKEAGFDLLPLSRLSRHFLHQMLFALPNNTANPFSKMLKRKVPQKEEVNIYLDAHFPPFQLPLIQRMMLFYSVIHT